MVCRIMVAWPRLCLHFPRNFGIRSYDFGDMDHWSELRGKYKLPRAIRPNLAFTSITSIRGVNLEICFSAIVPTTELVQSRVEWDQTKPDVVVAYV